MAGLGDVPFGVERVGELAERELVAGRRPCGGFGEQEIDLVGDFARIPVRVDVREGDVMVLGISCGHVETVVGSWNSPGDIPVGTSVPGDDEAWLGACIDRLDSMILRDRNHPSVLVWSLGNESYAGEVLKAMSAHAHRLDPGRPVHYEGVNWNHAYDGISDFESRMYAKPADIQDWLEHGDERGEASKPFVSCEYMHAMGNSCGGLSEFIDLERYERYSGGFIWDYIDQGLVQRLPDGSERLSVGGE